MPPGDHSAALDASFLQCRFARRLEWEEDERGRIIVFRPRLGENRLGRKAVGLLGLSDYRIRLDEIGSLVWRHCDSETRASEIAVELREVFGARIEPAEDRLHDFIVQMSRARMIKIIRQNAASPKTRRPIDGR